jgi:hypothetical protein
MKTTTANVHPFAVMLNPEAVLQAVERSERMQRLQRRVCRPLDKPLIPRISDLQAFDQAIDDDDSEIDLPDDDAAV